MKKIIAAVLSFSMIMALSACGNNGSTVNNDINNDDSSTAEVTAAAENEDKEASGEDAETTEADTGKNTEEKVDINSLVFDYKGLDSEECMTIFASKKYHISYTIDGMSQSLYYDNGNMFLISEYSGIRNDMLFKDGVQYMLSDDMYCIVPKEEAYLNNAGDMFENFGYLESGEIEYDGTNYKYDEYYQTSSSSKTKFLLSSDNKLIAFESMGMFMKVNEYSADFDSNAVINIPEGLNEVSHEELLNAMMVKYFGEDYAKSPEEVPSETEAAPAENDENAGSAETAAENAE